MSLRTTAEAYLRQMQGLLPSGAAWPRDIDSVLTALLSGLSTEYARVHNRAADMVEEGDPRTTLEMLPDWERLVGLPDECTGIVDTLQERRTAVVQRLTSRGGQSRAFFLGIAAALGYEGVTIDEFRPFICGLSHCGDALNGGPSVRYWWRVNVPDPRIVYFRTGASRAGDRLGDINRAEDLECIFRRLKPAQTELIFAYQGA